MFTLVKYKWRNAHGVWIGPKWNYVLTNEEPLFNRVKSKARLNAPSLTDVEVLDVALLPEDIRLTGRCELLRTHVVLYDNPNDFTPEQFIERMRERMSADASRD